MHTPLLIMTDFSISVTVPFSAADGRFKEAISFYEPLVQGHLGNLLEVTAIVLANLCICYIMTSQNDQAEALMRQVERQEEQQASAVSTRSQTHLLWQITTCLLPYANNHGALQQALAVSTLF